MRRFQRACGYDPRNVSSAARRRGLVLMQLGGRGHRAVPHHHQLLQRMRRLYHRRAVVRKHFVDIRKSVRGGVLGHETTARDGRHQSIQRRFVEQSHRG